MDYSHCFCEIVGFRETLVLDTDRLCEGEVANHGEYHRNNWNGNVGQYPFNLQPIVYSLKIGAHNLPNSPF